MVNIYRIYLTTRYINALLVHQFRHRNSAPSFKNSDGGNSPRAIDHNDDTKQTKNNGLPSMTTWRARAHFLTCF